MYQLLSKTNQQLSDKFIKLRKGHIFPNNRTHGGVTLLEMVNWLVKRMIVIKVSR